MKPTLQFFLYLIAGFVFVPLIAMAAYHFLGSIDPSVTLVVVLSLAAIVYLFFRMVMPKRIG